jgi:hypothetical protein
MTLPPKPPDKAAESRINTSHKWRHHARPFQFSLRDLFWLVIVVALAIGGRPSTGLVTSSNDRKMA